jgi:glycosyltransferase involved in cell wall biosynthesis
MNNLIGGTAIKVLHIFGKMNRGGAEMRTLELLPHLQKNGIHLDFCTLGESGEGHLDAQLQELGSTIYECPLDAGIWRFSRTFLNLLKAHRYDVVHSHVHYASGFILFLAARAKVPGRILHFRNTTDGCPATWKRKAYRRLMMNFADCSANKILAVCRGAMEAGWGGRWQQDRRAEVLYNGIDLSRYQSTGMCKQDLRLQLGLETDGSYLINVGRFNPQKGHDLLIEAFSKFYQQFPKVKLLLIGDGPLKLESEKKVQSLGLADQIRFLGLRSDVPLWLQASDGFVLSSHWEGLPGVVLEAVAAGLPVVSTAVPGSVEIAEFTDLVKTVPIGDVEALAGGMMDLVDRFDQTSQTKDMFQRSFEVENVAARLGCIYQEILKPKV